MKRFLSILMVLGVGVTATAHAAVTFVGQAAANDGTNHALSAKAKFTITGSTLEIVLTNTDMSSVGYTNEWGLTGLFWDFRTSQNLTASTATVASGSILNPAECNAGVNCSTETNVGGEFGYQKGSYNGGSPPNIGGYGIASSGYLRGQANFNGPDLDDPTALDGPNFSIVGKNSSGIVSGNQPGVASIKEKVTFVLTGLTNVTEADIYNIRFQYGTDFSESRFTGCLVGGPTCAPTIDPPFQTPEPTSLALAGIALLGATAARRRAKQA